MISTVFLSREYDVRVIMKGLRDGIPFTVEEDFRLLADHEPETSRSAGQWSTPGQKNVYTSSPMLWFH